MSLYKHILMENCTQGLEDVMALMTHNWRDSQEVWIDVSYVWLENSKTYISCFNFGVSVRCPQKVQMYKMVCTPVRNEVEVLLRGGRDSASAGVTAAFTWVELNK